MRNRCEIYRCTFAQLVRHCALHNSHFVVMLLVHRIRLAFELWDFHSSWFESFHKYTYQIPASSPLCIVSRIRFRHLRSLQTINKTIPWNLHAIRSRAIKHAMCQMWITDGIIFHIWNWIKCVRGRPLQFQSRARVSDDCPPAASNSKLVINSI